jgi:transcriptional regulator with XRE-family HTH domain
VPTPARTIDQRLARALRALREARSLSQEVTAQRAGITLNSYARIELGQAAPSWSTVCSIAEGLGVSLQELAAAVEAER